MRLLLKILAVICGIMCGLIAVVSLLLVLVITLPASISRHPVALLVVVGITGCAMAAVGLFLAWRMLGHLRHPGQKSATQVFAVTTGWLAFECINLIHGRTDRSVKIDYFANRTEAIASLAGIILLYLFYRLVLKRIAARAFPGGDMPATPAAISAT
jgi:hypothetical protein